MTDLARLQESKRTEVDMFTTVIIGNSTSYTLNGKMVTPRGYEEKQGPNNRSAGNVRESKGAKKYNMPPIRRNYLKEKLANGTGHGDHFRCVEQRNG